MAGFGASRPFALVLAGALAAALVLRVPAASHAQPDELACGQEPGNRFFWLERAFCDLPRNGPDRALGIVTRRRSRSGGTSLDRVIIALRPVR